MGWDDDMPVVVQRDEVNGVIVTTLERPGRTDSRRYRVYVDYDMVCETAIGGEAADVHFAHVRRLKDILLW